MILSLYHFICFLTLLSFSPFVLYKPPRLPNVQLPPRASSSISDYGLAKRRERTPPSHIPRSGARIGLVQIRSVKIPQPPCDRRPYPPPPQTPEMAPIPRPSPLWQTPIRSSEGGRGGPIPRCQPLHFFSFLGLIGPALGRPG